MATPVLQPAFTTGEIAPNLFGRQDLARSHTAATTMRNMFASYKGGSYSRPGTAFVGYSKQTGRTVPPRLIPFQFSINQGLMLEFGNFYMRVVINGEQVTENPIPISNITNANPAVVTAASGGSGSSAAPVNTGVSASYTPLDQITLAGGTFTTPAVLTVTSTLLLSTALTSGSAGIGYAPGDSITLAGGTFSAAAVLDVATTQVVSVALAAAGTGGTPGAAVVTGTTGTGTKFQANVTIDGSGAIFSVNSIAVPGDYTTNPSSLANEPVTGAGLVGAQLSVQMGVLGVFVSSGGSYTVNPPGNAFTQGSTSGGGTGAAFQSGIFGPNTVTFTTPGVYTVVPPNPVQQASTTGTGLGAEFNVTWTGGGPNGFVTGDWVFITGVDGMIEVNGQVFVITVLSTTTFSLHDVHGNNIDSTSFPAYTGSGTVSRIFTLTTIYAEADLEWLKFTQSADVMTLCCVNQETGTEYPAQDLERFSDTDWTFTPIVAVPAIAPPATCTLTASHNPGGVGTASYAYQVTAVAMDGTESIASPTGTLQDVVPIALTAGTITITWSTVPGATFYNIYKAEPVFDNGGTPPLPPVGSLFGFIGSAYGNQFIDSNITADFSQVPPLHRDPFARGQITAATITNPGSGYTNATAIVNTGTGSGVEIETVIVNGGVVALLVVDQGGGYLSGDTLTITGNGSGATGTITIGPETGTYPGTVSYFQQRRVFGNSLNNPDTYWMSQPGSFLNFDFRIPTIASDAITGSPWSLQVNGIQWFVLMPAGLATFTGLSAWLLVGAGSFATNVQPISPSSQVANPLAFTGCSALLPPIKINYDILYVTAKGSYYFDLPYQLYALSEPIDLTIFSSHLFDDFTVREHTWAEQPFKLLWTVRSDGTLLALTFLKQQQVAGWTRHDTNGFFWSIASCVESTIASVEVPDGGNQKTDAVYVAVQRAPG